VSLLRRGRRCRRSASAFSGRLCAPAFSTATERLLDEVETCAAEFDDLVEDFFEG